MVRNAHSLKLDLRLFSRDRTVPSLKMLKPSIEKVKLVLPVAATAEPPADYDRLNLYRYSSTPASLAAEVSWTFDTATWTLNSGRLWVQEPIADGTLTGFVFEGEGRFVMEIPDPYELAQLRRFCNNKELQRLDYRFTRLVVRGSNLSQLPLELTPPSAPQPLNLPRNRHEFWLRQYLLDANARTLVALRNPQAEYLRIAMLTDEDDWVVWERVSVGAPAAAEPRATRPALTPVSSSKSLRSWAPSGSTSTPTPASIG